MLVYVSDVFSFNIAHPTGPIAVPGLFWICPDIHYSLLWFPTSILHLDAALIAVYMGKTLFLAGIRCFEGLISSWHHVYLYLLDRPSSYWVRRMVFFDGTMDVHTGIRVGEGRKALILGGQPDDAASTAFLSCSEPLIFVHSGSPWSLQEPTMIISYGRHSYC